MIGSMIQASPSACAEGADSSGVTPSAKNAPAAAAHARHDHAQPCARTITLDDATTSHPSPFYVVGVTVTLMVLAPALDSMTSWAALGAERTSPPVTLTV